MNGRGEERGERGEETGGGSEGGRKEGGERRDKGILMEGEDCCLG